MNKEEVLEALEKSIIFAKEHCGPIHGVKLNEKDLKEQFKYELDQISDDTETQLKEMNKRIKKYTKNKNYKKLDILEDVKEEVIKVLDLLEETLDRT
jgi:hypothetical protein